MSLWSLIVPEATTNLCTNPSVETNTAGWGAFAGGSIARSALYSVDGLWSLAVTTDADVYDGVYWGEFAATSGATYTASVYVRGVVGVTYWLYISLGAHTSTPTAFTGDGTWHLYTNTYTAVATEGLYVYVTKNNHASTGVFYVDAMQVEAKAYATTHCNGSLTPPVGFSSSGCVWSGVHHASTSTRTATARAGGRERDFTTWQFYVTGHTGTAAPTAKVLTAPYISLDGAYYDSTSIQARSFLVTGEIIGTSLSNLQDMRGDLIDVLFPNTAREPVILRYDGTNRKLEISAHMEGGLEGGRLKGFTESVAIRFIAPYPYWREVIE